MSIKDFVRDKYGEEGVREIDELLKPIENPHTPVPTDVDMNVPLELPKERPPAQRCEYSFLVPGHNGAVMEFSGTGYWLDGLLIHREHWGYDGKEQDPNGRWNLSTKEGLLLYTFEYFNAAASLGALCAKALDFKKANSYAFTDEQMDALMRVLRWWRNDGSKKYDHGY